ncbi:MAG: alpha/beta fold hydrolase, partial [Flavobacteriaceae bacterium]
INESRFDGVPENHNSFITSWNTIKIQSILIGNEAIFEKVSYTNRLQEITIPSLVLWGKYDMIVPTVYAQEAFENLGSNDKELFIFQKSAHSPMFTEPDVFAEKVINFINQHK